MLPNRPHLLLCGWYRPGTGFTRVLQSLLPALCAHFRITWLGVGYRGPELELHPHVRVIPTNLHGGDMIGACAIRMHRQQWAPDVLLVLNDIWYLTHYSRELADLPERVPMVGYLPLDGAIDDPHPLHELRGFDELITYTDWAAQQLCAALRAHHIDTPVSVAGHGVSLAQFHVVGQPDLADRMRRAQALFGLDAPAFVVLNASRPDPRKRLDLSLEAFAGFAHGQPPEVRLCLHHAIAHEQFVAPLREQAERLGIAERLLWFPTRPGPLDDTDLNALYNACAVGLNTAMGEGFGLVSFEHAATGAPQVLPAHAAMREIWQECALLVEPVQLMHTPHSPLLMGEVSVHAVAAALRRLYTQAACYRRYSQAALARCARADLNWSEPAARLLSALRRACSLPD